MDYKITVERIEPPEEGKKYNDTTKLYEQKFKSSSETQLAEDSMLRKIIDAVNK
jgi:hypothetical protein